MRQLTIHIPEGKIDFFMDLARNLGFKVEDNVPKNILTGKQIEMVNEARKKIKDEPEQFSDWDDIRKTINVG